MSQDSSFPASTSSSSRLHKYAFTKNDTRIRITSVGQSASLKPHTTLPLSKPATKDYFQFLVRISADANEIKQARLDSPQSAQIGFISICDSHVTPPASFHYPAADIVSLSLAGFLHLPCSDSTKFIKINRRSPQPSLPPSSSSQSPQFFQRTMGFFVDMTRRMCWVMYNNLLIPYTFLFLPPSVSFFVVSETLRIHVSILSAGPVDISSLPTDGSFPGAGGSARDANAAPLVAPVMEPFGKLASDLSEPNWPVSFHHYSLTYPSSDSISSPMYSQSSSSYSYLSLSSSYSIDASSSLPHSLTAEQFSNQLTSFDSTFLPVDVLSQSNSVEWQNDVPSLALSRTVVSEGVWHVEFQFSNPGPYSIASPSSSSDSLHSDTQATGHSRNLSVSNMDASQTMTFPPMDSSQSHSQLLESNQNTQVTNTSQVLNTQIIDRTQTQTVYPPSVGFCDASLVFLPEKRRNDDQVNSPSPLDFTKPFGFDPLSVSLSADGTLHVSGRPIPLATSRSFQRTSTVEIIADMDHHVAYIALNKNWVKRKIMNVPVSICFGVCGSLLTILFFFLSLSLLGLDGN